MTITAKNLTRSKPFYVVAGAGDLAVRKLREVPAKISELKVDRSQIETTLASTISTLQAETKAFPAKAQTAAVTVAGDVVGKADEVYGELLTRGRTVVGRIRRQKSTQDLKKQAGTTVRRTKAAATTAKTGAGETRSSARGTATTAKKRAATTKKAAKSATTSARKTAGTATKATGDAAGKVGS
ncbi:MAG: hypothetical protein QOE01_929 [Actinomycetota bacterium]|jgi:hypothetical protein|nr:hypothetical protein [Actinomycetota bacterium]